MSKKITLAKIMPCGAQLIKTVEDWGDGRCTEQTKICKNLVVETVLFETVSIVVTPFNLQVS